MILKNSSFMELFNCVSDQSIWCYGIGDFFYRTIDNFGEFDWNKKLGGLLDGSCEKEGSIVTVKGINYRINSIQSFINNKKEGDILLITTKAYGEIIEKLDDIEELKNIDCYIYFFMCNKSLEKVDIIKAGEYKIPAIIHYCWFGHKELPDLYKKCIDSWYKFCPDYEIIEWNEENLNIEENLYSKQAYERGRFGFVPDYFRLKIIHDNGGIYLDTDVELIRNLDDLRHESFFCGMQYPGQVALGLGFGSVHGHEILNKLMKTYDDLAFINDDGKENLKASPTYQTNDFIRLGMKKSNRKQYVQNACIYPTEVLSPINIYVGTHEITECTYSIHHFDGSWVPKDRKKSKNEELFFANKIAERMRMNG